MNPKQEGQDLGLDLDAGYLEAVTAAAVELGLADEVEGGGQPDAISHQVGEAARHGTAQHSTAWHGTAQHSMVGVRCSAVKRQGQYGGIESGESCLLGCCVGGPGSAARAAAFRSSQSLSLLLV